MLKAVGETVVVDILFLVLGLVSSGSLTNLSSSALWSSVFSILELVTELQHYVNEAEPYLIEDEDFASTADRPGELGPRAVRELPGPQRRSRDVSDATTTVLIS